MRITIQPQDDAGTELETDQELRRAFNVLRNALIQTRGGGRFADSSAAIILTRETDAPEALAALKHAGIRALMSWSGERSDLAGLHDSYCQHSYYKPSQVVSWPPSGTSRAFHSAGGKRWASTVGMNSGTA